MNRTVVKYEDGLKKALSDPLEAAAYLNAALEEGSEETFLLALRDIAEAKGISYISYQSKLNRKSLHTILSPGGNPQLTDLNSILRSVGLKLAVITEHTS